MRLVATHDLSILCLSGSEAEDRPHWRGQGCPSAQPILCSPSVGRVQLGWFAWGLKSAGCLLCPVHYHLSLTCLPFLPEDPGRQDPLCQNLRVPPHAHTGWWRSGLCPRLGPGMGLAQICVPPPMRGPLAGVASPAAPSPEHSSFRKFLCISCQLMHLFVHCQALLEVLSSLVFHHFSGFWEEEKSLILKDSVCRLEREISRCVGAQPWNRCSFSFSQGAGSWPALPSPGNAVLGACLAVPPLPPCVSCAVLCWLALSFALPTRLTLACLAHPCPPTWRGVLLLCDLVWVTMLPLTPWAGWAGGVQLPVGPLSHLECDLALP